MFYTAEEKKYGSMLSADTSYRRKKVDPEVLIEMSDEEEGHFYEERVGGSTRTSRINAKIRRWIEEG